MDRPIVVVDVDDVLVEAAPVVIAAYNRQWQTSLTLASVYAPHDPGSYGGVDGATATQRMYTYMESPEFLALEPTQEARRCLHALAATYELHILTGRNDSLELVTKTWLRKHFPDVFNSVQFSNLMHDTKMRTKGEMCAELGAAFLVDDHLGNIISAAEHGVRGVVFGDYPWNQAEELPSGVVRCKDWPAVLEYLSRIG